MKLIKRLLALILLACLCIGGFITFKGYKMYEEALAQVSLADKVESIRANPEYTTFEELPEMYVDAVIAVEDHRYYTHKGMDIIATGRALWNDIKARQLIEGGSTITQQLAKNLFFTQEKEFTRKVAEVFMAFEIEKHYSKEEIFELYVNSIFFGDNYYCVRDASRGYFGKEPSQMTDYESTLLAGIPNAPSAYTPTVNPELAAQRQSRVLERMVKYDYITQDMANAIMQ